MIKDIRTFKPIDNSKEFFIDTNVLYWYSYSKYDLFNTSTKKQAQPYLDFLEMLIYNKHLIFTSIYNLSELLHIIEKHEFSIYQETNKELKLSIKDFRILTSRKYVKNELLTALANTKNLCTILNYSFSLSELEEFIDTSDRHRCDNYDFIIIKNCIEKGKINIISDDSDFSTLDKINLYTANENILGIK